MLGETANIRTNSIPYFQIFIIFDKVPYYGKGGEFKNEVYLENKFHSVLECVNILVGGGGKTSV